MIDIDKLEHLARQATSEVNGARLAFKLGVIEPEHVIELVAEMRRLQRLLSNPLFTGAKSPFFGGVVGEPGLNQDVAKTAFYDGVSHVSVFYGEERIYTSLAQFMVETQS